MLSQDRRLAGACAFGNLADDPPARPTDDFALNLPNTEVGGRGNPHAAFDEAGAGNVARPRWCDTRRRKSEPTGNTNFGLNLRVSPRPYR